jgi:hypothetical protein
MKRIVFSLGTILICQFSVAAYGQQLTSIWSDDYHTFEPYFEIDGLQGKTKELSRPKDCKKAISIFHRDIGLPKSTISPLPYPVDLSWRKVLTREYEDYLVCNSPDSDSDTSDFAEQMLPWILSTSDMHVVLVEHPSIRRSQADGEIIQGPVLSAEEGHRQHTSIETPDGFAIGMMFAQDPEPKFDAKGMVYEFTDKAPEIIRSFKSLTTTSLGKPIDISLEIVSTNHMVAGKGNAQFIVKDGQMQMPVWDFVPNSLRRQWYDDDEEPVQLTGTVREYAANDPLHPYRQYGVDIPNPTFRLRRVSRRNAMLVGIKEFLTSVPNWVAVIEAAVIGFIGFVKLGWLKAKPEEDSASRGGESIGTD